MQRNLGTTDRWARVVIMAAALSAGLAVGYASAAGIVLLVAAAVLLATSATGFCPLYVPFRLSSRRRRFAEVRPR